MTQLNSDKTRLEKEFKTLETTVRVQSDLEKLRDELAQQNQQKEQQVMADIQQKFEELNKNTNTSQIKVSLATPETDLNTKIDRFFKKK